MEINLNEYKKSQFREVEGSDPEPQKTSGIGIYVGDSVLKENSNPQQIIIISLL